MNCGDFKGISSPHLCVGFLFLILYPGSSSSAATSFTHSFTHHLSNTTLSHKTVTQNFVTHPLSHTIFHTPSFTYHLSHTIFHTPSFTHHLSHTSLTHHHLHHLSHTIFHILSLTHHLSSFTDHLLHTATLCVARVALDDIHLRFAWQAWHLWH